MLFSPLPASSSPVILYSARSVLTGVVEPTQGFVRLLVAMFSSQLEPLDGGDVTRLRALTVEVQEPDDRDVSLSSF